MAATRVLLVEDDEDDYILALDYLEEITFLDIDVVRAINASEALRLLEEQDFDLCLLDYQLGAVNGLEVLKQAQALNVSAPIIMLTGQSDEALDQEALNAGAADYLIKNELNAARFARAIRYALARRDVEKERVERLKAEAENRSKNRFLAHLSHELRTPLTAILGYTELLLNDESSGDIHPELEVILRNGKHLLDLLNDVLDLSKIAADKLELNIGEVSVDSLFADIYALMSFSAIDKGLKLKLHSDDPIPLEIFTDATRLRQVLINLINNAIKFTDEGQVDIHLKMEVGNASEQLRVDVVDTGVGVPESHLDTIFKPFSQVADVVSKSVGGSGLGLAISSELARRLGGELSVSSEPGKGSCFTLTIATGDVSAADRQHLTFKTQSSHRRFDARLNLEGRVLVVDDLRDIRRLIGHIVERAGIHASYAANGAQALSAVKKAKQDFDLILMDIHMPEMDGITAVRHIRDAGVQSPIVALTAASMRGSRARLVDAGFDDLLSKPVDSEKLSSLLKLHLKPKAEDEASAAALDSNVDHINVLLVEDDEDAASALSMLLEGIGADVHVCHTVRDGRKMVDAQVWDAVLLDLNLPDESGSSLAEYIRHLNLDCYIALISGASIDQEMIAAIDIDSCLLKPIQLDDLRRLLDKAKARKIASD